MTTEIPYLELGATGILGVSFVLIIRWMLYQMSVELRETGNAIRTLSLIQMDFHKTLLVHDAQIRGINPSAGKDATDSHQRAEAEYLKVLASIDATKELIKETIKQKKDFK